MLSEPKACPGALRRVIEELIAKKSAATAVANRVADFLKSSGGAVVSFTGQGVLPAKALSFALVVLAHERPVSLLSASTLAYHWAPYLEEGERTATVIFYGSAWERSELLRVLDAFNLMGVEYLIVSLSPPDDIVLKKAAKDSVLSLPSSWARDVIATWAALRSAASLVKLVKGEVLRVKRLESELENLVTLEEDLAPSCARLQATLAKCLEGSRSVSLVHTPSMEVPALLTARLLSEQGVFARSFDASVAFIEGIGRDCVITLSTMVEFDAIKETGFKLVTRGIHAEHVVLNFDPLTAQLYASICATATLSTGRSGSI